MSDDSTERFPTFAAFVKLFQRHNVRVFLIGAVAAPLAAAVLMPLAGMTVLPLLAFASSDTPAVAVAGVAGLYLILALPSAISRRVGQWWAGGALAILFLLQAFYTYATWNDGVWRYGLVHTASVNVAAHVLLGISAFLWLQSRRRNSFVLLATCCSVAAAWPVTLGFPYLFELP